MSACEACGSKDLVAIPDYARLRRVTSDCLPFASGGTLCACSSCGAVQKVNDEAWRRDCAAIYGAYDNYGLTEGGEQYVRSADGSEFSPRSTIILKRLNASLGLPQRGRLLDFGCGKGVTARAAAALSGWTIDGFEQDDRTLPELSRIDGFNRLYTEDPSALPTGYDLIVLMHALEHIPGPSSLLRLLASKLRPGGCIACQVPDRDSNPYDLLVADHLLHFDGNSLEAVANRGSANLTSTLRTWIPKELTLIMSQSAPVDPPSKSEPHVDVADQVEWLLRVAKVSHGIGNHGPLCVFGTSIVATWLVSELPRPPDLYLDEDPAKIGRSLGGVPIISPIDAPAGATVLMAISPTSASAVAKRFAFLNFVELPPYPPRSRGV